MNSASSVRLLILQAINPMSGLCVSRGKVLTLNEGLAMAPLLIPEQPAVVRLERNRVSLTQRKPDATVSRAFPAQLCSTCSHLPWAPDFNTPFLKHHLRATLGPRRMSRSVATCLSPVSQPTHDTWYSEQNREEVKRETFSAINAQQNLRSWPTYPLLDKSNRCTPPVSCSISFPTSEGRYDLTS